MLNKGLPLIALVLLAACARSEDASVVIDNNELQEVEQVRTPEQDDGDVALGNWRQTLQDDNEALEFGPMGTAPLFSLRCDARRSLSLQLHGAAATGDLPVMLVTIGSETRRLAVTNAGGAVPLLRATVGPTDPLVETLASAESPITVRVGDTLPLVIPPDPAVGSFLARCLRGEAAVPAESENGVEAAPGPNAAEPDAPGAAE